MRGSRLWPVLRSLGIALLLLLACIAYVPARGELGGAALCGGSALCGDARYYAAMIDGSERVPEPYRFRPMVPWLAAAFPCSPAQALLAVSWLSLLATYVLLLESARLVRISRVASVLGLAAAIATAPHLYNYFNPYLTDATGLLVIATGLYALLARRHILFSVACVLGAGVREPLVLVAPSWGATGQWKKTAVPFLLSCLLLLAIRLLVGPSGLPEKGPFMFPARPLSHLLRDALASWQVLWLLAPLGLWSISRGGRELRWLAGMLLASALITSLLASDTMRMFQPLFPVIALGLSAFVEQLWQSARALTASLLTVCFASSLVWQPVRLFALPPHADTAIWLRALAFALLAAVGAWAAASFWRHKQTLTTDATLEAQPSLH